MGNGVHDELIRKQDAIDALDVLCQEHRYKIPGKAETYSQYNEAWQDALDRAEGAIGNLPPVQSERIKGHWVEITSFNHTYKCSVCGRLLVNITDGKNKVAKNYPYCHCGADMRTEETDCDYERAVEQLEHDMLYEPTFNPDDGSM